MGTKVVTRDTHPLRVEEAKVVKVSSNPDRFELQPTGVEIPVRYYTDIASGAHIAFVIDDDCVEIVRVRTKQGTASQPAADMNALKSFLCLTNLTKPSPKLSAADLSRITSASSLTPREVK